MHYRHVPSAQKSLSNSLINRYIMIDLLEENRFHVELKLSMPDHGDGTNDEEEDKTDDPPPTEN